MTMKSRFQLSIVITSRNNPAYHKDTKFTKEALKNQTKDYFVSFVSSW